MQSKQLHQHGHVDCVVFAVFSSVILFHFIHLIGILCLDVAFQMAILLRFL